MLRSRRKRPRRIARRRRERIEAIGHGEIHVVIHENAISGRNGQVGHPCRRALAMIEHRYAGDGLLYYLDTHSQLAVRAGDARDEPRSPARVLSPLNCSFSILPARRAVPRLRNSGDTRIAHPSVQLGLDFDRACHSRKLRCDSTHIEFVSSASY